jgi:dihydrofolate reductase
MIVSLIAAMAQNRVIGNNNELPWRLPADLKHFRQLTMGKPVLMGRKTFESIGKPLPGRTNIIVTKNPGFSAKGCNVVHDIDAALKQAGSCTEVMVIGGASLYSQTLPLADRIYLTIIHQDFIGDTRLPAIDDEAWEEIGREDYLEPDAVNHYPYSFIVLQKKRR